MISLLNQVLGSGIDAVRLPDFVELIQSIACGLGALRSGRGFAFFFSDGRGLYSLVDFAIFRNPGCESLRSGHFMVRFSHSAPSAYFYSSGFPVVPLAEDGWNACILMTALRIALLLCVWAAAVSGASNAYEFTLNSIDGKPTPLTSFKGKVTLFVNVASQCGFTPQYSALEAIYEKYKDKGFTIAGFPANDFGSQEPGTNAEIKQFCDRKYSVKFPMFAKISVVGDEKAPLYRYLTGVAGPEIQWNFTKFLVDRNGKVLQRFDSAVEPDSPEMIAAIEAALKQ